jgi:branched-chain amino acid transport system ATP-binding protein
VSDVNLVCDHGAVVGLIGPNGAGKTTTFNMMSGVQTPTAGSVWLEGVDLRRAGTHQRARKGIGRTFQRLEVFASMTVRDNVLVAAEIRQGWSRTSPSGPQLLAPQGVELDALEEVHLLLERLGLGAVADTRVGQLPTGQARLVELARALAIRPKLLLLDEPASGLDDRETEEFGELLVELAGAGLGILLVEHDVPLVMKVCDRVYVLDFGQIIAEGTPAEIQSNATVLDAYLGTAAT